MELINQPFNGQLGNRLLELIDSQNYHTINIAVAFAKNSGVLRLRDALEKFREQGGKVNIYVGIDMKVTSYEALTNLLKYSDSLTIIHADDTQTFHSKIYQFLGNDNNILIVGSNNLTGGGLWTNFESAIVVTIDNLTNSHNELLERTKDYFNKLQSHENLIMQINSQDDIDLLFEYGYILKEIQKIIIKRLLAKDNKLQKKLFGNNYKAKLPNLKTFNKTNKTTSKNLILKPVRIELTDLEDETIWLETRGMTGGSGNILDLSKTSLVENGQFKNTIYDYGDEKSIRGTVEFFGINPKNEDESRKITINFEGIDFKNNTIKIHKDGKKPNGSWRIQLNGINSVNQSFLDFIHAKPEYGKKYLANKIITFTKIKDDYYTMSIFPDSELDNFKKISRIVAHNGLRLTHKYNGII